MFGVKDRLNINGQKAKDNISTLPDCRLDNDEDGCVDNPLALTKYLAMKPQPAILVPGTGDLTNTVAEAFDKAGFFCNAPLYTGEILPKCSGPAATSSCADATLEEVSTQNLKSSYDIFQFIRSCTCGLLTASQMPILPLLGSRLLNLLQLWTWLGKNY